jgi:hypothetical protein
MHWRPAPLAASELHPTPQAVSECRPMWGTADAEALLEHEKGRPAWTALER